MRSRSLSVGSIAGFCEYFHRARAVRLQGRRAPAPDARGRSVLRLRHNPVCAAAAFLRGRECRNRGKKEKALQKQCFLRPSITERSRFEPVSPACPADGRNDLWALRHHHAIRPPAPADLGIASLFQMPQAYGNARGGFHKSVRLDFTDKETPFVHRQKAFLFCLRATKRSTNRGKND